jgi:N-acetyl-anhydromuramyl-L-alanine amidase AmpD
LSINKKRNIKPDTITEPKKSKDAIKDEELDKIKTYEKWFETNNGYTENQYESLKQLLCEIGKRYSYNVVASEHRLGPTSGGSMKSNLGMYFDWTRIIGGPATRLT